MRTMKRVQQGFTLIELMIVIAIIAILVALAVPAYQDYTVRTKVSECINNQAPIKLAVSESYMSEGQMPADLTTAGVNTAAGDTTFCNTPTYAGAGQTGTITVSVDNAAIGGSAVGATITPQLVGTGNATTGDVSWDCQPNGSETRFLPSTCRN